MFGASSTDRNCPPPPLSERSIQSLGLWSWHPGWPVLRVRGRSWLGGSGGERLQEQMNEVPTLQVHNPMGNGAFAPPRPTVPLLADTGSHGNTLHSPPQFMSSARAGAGPGQAFSAAAALTG